MSNSKHTNENIVRNDSINTMMSEASISTTTAQKRPYDPLYEGMTEKQIELVENFKRQKLESDERAEKADERAKKAELENVQLKKSCKRSFPPMTFNGKYATTMTTFGSIDDYPNFEVKVVDFELNKNITFESLLEPKEYILWRNTEFIASTEADVTDAIRPLVTECISLLPSIRAKSYQVTREACLVGLHPASIPKLDLCVLKSPAGIPFFVCEVKKPGLWRRPNNLFVAQHQLYTYLLSVKRQYGIKTPYGMLSSYDYFQICWLDKDEGSQQEETLHCSKVYILHANDGDVKYHRNILLTLLSAMKAGYDAPRVGYRTGIKGFYHCFTASHIDRRSVSVPKLLFKMPVLPLTTEKTHLFIFRHFEAGKEGRAFHVFGIDGAQAVVKLYNPYFNHWAPDHNVNKIADLAHDKSEEIGPEKLTAEKTKRAKKRAAKKITDEANGLCQAEQKLWKKINSIEIKVETIHGQPGLVMPYLSPLTRDEEASFLEELKYTEKELKYVEPPLTDSKGFLNYAEPDPEYVERFVKHVESFTRCDVRNCKSIFQQVLHVFRALADKGFEQTDASWRHVGWYRYDDKPRLMLFDFGHLEKRDSQKAKDDAFYRMVQQLKTELNCYEVGSESPIIKFFKET